MAATKHTAQSAARGDPLQLAAHLARATGRLLAGVALAVLVLALGCTPPLMVGIVGGLLWGRSLPATLLVTAAAVGFTYVYSRAVLTGVWWAKTAEWNWRRTSLRAALNRGRW